MEQLVNIELFGQNYTFRAESDVTQAREVADLLVEEVSRVEQEHVKKTPNINRLAVLISAALNIANDNVELKKRYSELVDGFSERSDKLLRLLDAKAA